MMPESMSLYLSGPMTGYPRFNYDAFEDATDRLRKAGYTVYSPHELDEDLGFREEGFDPDVPDSFTPEMRRMAMRHDLFVITTFADAVAVLPGWSQSKGARLEVEVAGAIGLRVAPVEAWLSEAEYREALRRAFR